MRPLDAITENEIQAYIDGRLPQLRRTEIECELRRRPELAIRAMVDLRTRDELRVALMLADEESVPRGATNEAALRLQRGLHCRRIFGFGRLGAVSALLIGLGWMAYAEFGPLGIGDVVASSPPPAYVADAMMSHRTALLRAAMLSQPEAPVYDAADAAEIRSATAISMPNLPAGWEAVDVQVFPSTFGPSVYMAIQSDEMGAVSLFAVRLDSFEAVPRRNISYKGKLAAVYWQIGEVAYALVAEAQAQDLEQEADRLIRTLR